MKPLWCGVLLTGLTLLAAIQPTTVLAEAETRRISNEARVRASPEGQAFWAAYQQKNVPEMMKLAQALVEAFPNEAFAHACAGDAYAEAGLQRDALASYQHALELDSKSYEAEWKIGSWYDNAGDPTNALEHFERAVKIKPESPSTWALIGLTHYRTGNFRDAATALTQSVKLDATDNLDTMERTKLKSYIVQSKRMLKNSRMYMELRAIESNRAKVYNRRTRSKSLRLIEQALEHDLRQRQTPLATPLKV